MPPKTHLRNAWVDPQDWEQRSNTMLFSPSTKSVITTASTHCSLRTPCLDDMPYRVGSSSMTLCDIYECKPFPVITMTLSAAYYNSAFFGSEILSHVQFLLRSVETRNGKISRFGGGLISALTQTCSE